MSQRSPKRPRIRPWQKFSIKEWKLQRAVQGAFIYHAVFYNGLVIPKIDANEMLRGNGAKRQAALVSAEMGSLCRKDSTSANTRRQHSSLASSLIRTRAHIMFTTYCPPSFVFSPLLSAIHFQKYKGTMW